MVKCDELAYLIKVVRWCCNKLVELSKGNEAVQIGKIGMNKDDVESIPNIVYNTLKDHSIVFVMHSYLHLIGFDEMVDLIQSNPDKKVMTTAFLFRFCWCCGRCLLCAITLVVV